MYYGLALERTHNYFRTRIQIPIPKHEIAVCRLSYIIMMKCMNYIKNILKNNIPYTVCCHDH